MLPATRQLHVRGEDRARAVGPPAVDLAAIDRGREGVALCDPRPFRPGAAVAAGDQLQSRHHFRFTFETRQKGELGELPERECAVDVQTGPALECRQCRVERGIVCRVHGLVERHVVVQAMEVALGHQGTSSHRFAAGPLLEPHRRHDEHVEIADEVVHLVGVVVESPGQSFEVGVREPFRLHGRRKPDLCGAAARRDRGRSRLVGGRLPARRRDHRGKQKERGAPAVSYAQASWWNEIPEMTES